MTRPFRASVTAPKDWGYPRPVGAPKRSVGLWGRSEQATVARGAGVKAAQASRAMGKLFKAWATRGKETP